MIPLMEIFNIGGKIIDKIWPDPAQADQAKLKLLEMQQNGELAKMQADMQEQGELTKRQENDMRSDSRHGNQQGVCRTVGSVGYADNVFLLWRQDLRKDY